MLVLRKVVLQRVSNRDFKRLENNIVLTVFRLEIILPPGFFTIVIHLPIHSAGKVILCKSVQYHWMYPFESVCIHLKYNINFRSIQLFANNFAFLCLNFSMYMCLS